MSRALLFLGLVLAARGFTADRSAAWGVLDKSLGEGSVDRRQEALVALTTMESNKEAVRRAEAALKDKDALIRQSAALTLGQLKDKDAIPALHNALSDSPEVAFAAAKALTAAGDAGGRDVLIAVLAGERKGGPGLMTNGARKVKNELHHPEGLFLKGAQDATGAMFGPVSMVIPLIRDTAELKSKGSMGRAAAAAWLAKDPDPYAISLLEWALDDDSPVVRAEAAKGLGERGNGDSLAKLEPLLSDSNNFVRDMAAAAAIRIMDRNGQPGAVSEVPVAPAAALKTK